MTRILVLAIMLTLTGLAGRAGAGLTRQDLDRVRVDLPLARPCPWASMRLPSCCSPISTAASFATRSWARWRHLVRRA